MRPHPASLADVGLQLAWKQDPRELTTGYCAPLLSTIHSLGCLGTEPQRSLGSTVTWAEPGRSPDQEDGMPPASRGSSEERWHTTAQQAGGAEHGRFATLAVGCPMHPVDDNPTARRARTCELVAIEGGVLELAQLLHFRQPALQLVVVQQVGCQARQVQVRDATPQVVVGQIQQPQLLQVAQAGGDRALQVALRQAQPAAQSKQQACS